MQNIKAFTKVHGKKYLYIFILKVIPKEMPFNFVLFQFLTYLNKVTA